MIVPSRMTRIISSSFRKRAFYAQTRLTVFLPNGAPEQGRERPAHAARVGSADRSMRSNIGGAGAPLIGP